ncbi:MAG TPA: IS630 family transposase [Chloroflexota bacterium]
MQKWKWIVNLTDEQDRELQSLVRKGRASARRITRARVLLLAAEDRPDDEVAAVLHTSRSTVERIRRRFVEHGLEAALSERPRPGAAPKLDERGQATLIALACSNPPDGRASWTMQLLADELVVRRVVPSISDEAVRRTLKKTGLKPWLQEHWCIPEVSPAFVAAMEDVLDLYAEPYDPRRPVVGFDERPLQLLDDTRAPVPPAPGRTRRVDYEYRRNGTGNVFTSVEPLAGWRHVEVTERRTAVDFAHQMRWLVDEAYPNAKVIRVVLDNLNIHTIASLYAAFPPQEARRIARKLEFHPTPKHGSWLNVAESELAVLSNQCLNRRLPTLVSVRREVTAWERQRNAKQVKIHWLFTTAHARRKLRHAYPIPA